MRTPLRSILRAAAEPEWVDEPLFLSFCGTRTTRPVRVGEQLEYRPFPAVRLFFLAIGAIGLAALAFGLYRLLRSEWQALFFVVWGGVWTIPLYGGPFRFGAVFDRENREVRRNRQRPGDPEAEPFSNFVAVQLLTHRPHRKRGAEINLVRQDSTRFPVAAGENERAIRTEAEAVAAFLNLPLRDQTGSGSENSQFRR